MASDRYVMYLTQGGLSLPDESYYRDEKFAEVRAEFLGHVERMFVKAGVTDEAGAKDAAQRILALESKLAQSHWDRVTNRDATKTYNKKNRAELEELIPAFDWTAWIDALKVPQSAFGEVVVRQPRSSPPSVRRSRSSRWPTGRPGSPGARCTARPRC